MLNSFKKVGNYEISDICLESYPCKHIIQFEDGRRQIMSGDDIYRLFQMEGLTDPHIDKYAEFVKQQDFPSVEEIKKRTDDKLRIQEISKKRAEEEAEQQKIIHQYKASSRLDKLKKV